MSFDNINLWYAKDEQDNIILAKEVLDEMKHNKFRCPICNSLVRPKRGEIMSWHFAHYDASKCSSETMIHWWMKNELLKVGDTFKVNINGSMNVYTCKEVVIEKEYETSFDKVYKPDLTIITEDKETIFIEIANTNKKKLKDFIDIWKELGNIVVEVSTGDLINGNKINNFNAIYYDGKEYYEQLKELRELGAREKEKYDFTKEQLEQIDWLLDDICRYNNCMIEIDQLSDEIQAVEDEKLRELIVNIVRNKKCGTVLEDYIEYNKNKIKILPNKYIEIYEQIKIPNKIYDRVYGYYEIILKNNYNIKLKDTIYNIIKYVNTLNYVINMEKLFKFNISIKEGKHYYDNPILYINKEEVKKTMDVNYIDDFIYNVIDKQYIKQKNEKVKNKSKRYLLSRLKNKFIKSGYDVELYRDYGWEYYNKLLVKKNIECEYGEIEIKKYYNWNYKFSKEEVESFMHLLYKEQRKRLFCDYIMTETEARCYEVYYKGCTYVEYGSSSYELINDYDIKEESNILKKIKIMIEKEKNRLNSELILNKLFNNLLIMKLDDKLKIKQEVKIIYKNNKKYIKCNTFYCGELISKFECKYSDLSVYKLNNEILNILNNEYLIKLKYSTLRKKYLKQIFYKGLNEIGIKYCDIRIDTGYKNSISDIYKFDVYVKDYPCDFFNDKYKINIFENETESLNKVCININNIKFDKKYENIIDQLNERFEKNVYRKPNIYIGDKNKVIINIKCINKYNKPFFKYIGEFTIDNYDSIKTIEEKSCNIIRNYIYKIKD